MRIISLFLAMCGLYAGEIIGPLSLDEAEAIALKKNKSIHLSEQEVGQYNARKWQAITSWFPSLSFASMYTMLEKKQTLFLDRDSTRFFSNQFQLNQPILSTDLIFNMRASKFYWESTRVDKDLTVNDTLYQVRTLYYLVVLKTLSLQVQEEVIGYLSEALKDEEVKKAAGKAISFEVNQSKVALSNAISMYHSLLKELKTARSQLTLALGIDPTREGDIRLSETSLPIERFPELQQKLATLKEKASSIELQTMHCSLFSEKEIEEKVKFARDQRPEIRKSALLIRAAKEEVNNKKWRYLPTISAFADYGYYLPINGLFLKQQNNFAGGFLLNWNLFDSMKREFQIKEATCIRNAARIGLERERDKTAIDVRSELYQIEEALFAYFSAHEAFLLAQQGMQEAKSRLSAGSIPPLEYRDATRAYAEAHRQSDQTKYAILQAYFQLCHDMGVEHIPTSSLECSHH